jgi:hypothetical protein
MFNCIHIQRFMLSDCNYSKRVVNTSRVTDSLTFIGKSPMIPLEIKWLRQKASIFAPLHGIQSWMYQGQLTTIGRKMPRMECVLIITSILDPKSYESIHCKQQLLCVLCLSSQPIICLTRCKLWKLEWRLYQNTSHHLSNGRILYWS